MRVTSASSNGNKKIDGPGGTMFEQYLKQSDVRGSKSINRCPKLSFVASSHDFSVLHKRTTFFCKSSFNWNSCLQLWAYSFFLLFQRTSKWEFYDDHEYYYFLIWHQLKKLRKLNFLDQYLLSLILSILLFNISVFEVNKEDCQWRP